MKTKTYALIVAAVVAFSTAAAIAQTELATFSDDMLLIAKPNAALADISQLYVVIVQTSPPPDNQSLFFHELKAGIGSKLKEAGIDVADAAVTDPNVTKVLKRRFESIENLEWRRADIPELRVNMHALDIEEHNSRVFSIQTSLAKKVCLSEQPKRHIKADVWKTDLTMKIILTEQMLQKVSDIIFEQTDAFITAYLIANNSNTLPAKANSTKPLSGKPDTPRDQRTQKQDTVEVNFVASKKSKVFHKPDCPFARRISPENLVTYKTRDEAINAGKRPCKRCKP